MTSPKLFLILTTTLLGAFGCNKSANQKANTDNQDQVDSNTFSQVAVIDLDVIAKKLGRDKEFLNSVQERTSSLNQQITTIRQSFAKEIQTKKVELSNSSAADQESQIARMEKIANQKLQEIQQKSRQHLVNYRGEMANEFRQEALAAADEVAKKLGIQLVFTKSNPNIFSCKNCPDISEQVASHMQANPRKESQPEVKTASASAANSQTIQR